MQDNVPLSHVRRKNKLYSWLLDSLCPDYIYCRLLSFLNLNKNMTMRYPWLVRLMSLQASRWSLPCIEQQKKMECITGRFRGMRKRPPLTQIYRFHVVFLGGGGLAKL